jgi:hypothetical protein
MKKFVIFSAFAIMIILVLTRTNDNDPSEAPILNRVVVRFIEPLDEIVAEFNNPQYDVVDYEPGISLDIVMTESEFEDLQLNGYEIVMLQTEEEFIREFIRKSEEY